MAAVGDALAAAARAAAAVALRALCSPASCILKSAQATPDAQNFPAHAAGFVAEIADAPVGRIGESVALDAAEGAAHAFGHVWAAVVGDDEAAARNEIDEALEGGFDGFEVGVDVGVVELDVGEDERVGKVVEKLGALVEEGGVVLVAFEDEVARGTELKARAEIFRDAADEERRLKRGICARGDLVDPGQHAGGGGFAVGSGDDERFAAFEKFLAQQRGHGGEGNALVEDAFDFRIAAGERIADDDEIGSGIEIRFGVGLEDGNAERAKQIAHGRIGGLVGAGDAMALELKQAGERGHGRAADADEVDVARRRRHFVTAGSRMRRLRRVADGELGFDAEGERDIFARNVAAAQADGDGHVEADECAENGFVKERRRRARRCAIEHFAKDDAANAVELSCMTQLPEHAIDLVGLDAGVFKKKQLAFGARLPWRAERAIREC